MFGSRAGAGARAGARGGAGAHGQARVRVRALGPFCSLFRSLFVRYYIIFKVKLSISKPPNSHPPAAAPLYNKHFIYLKNFTLVFRPSPALRV